MKKIISIFLFSYYLLGNLILPAGDFSILADLKEMYRDCKNTEDKNLTPFDFVTDHLINIDCLFDAHKRGDKQRPHSPANHHHVSTTIIACQFIQPYTFIQPSVFISLPEIKFSNDYPNYTFMYLDALLRPPISC